MVLLGIVVLYFGLGCDLSSVWWRFVICGMVVCDTLHYWFLHGTVLSVHWYLYHLVAYFIGSYMLVYELNCI